MTTLKPLKFVVLLGSLRRGSYNAAVARALPSLAPEGVTVELLDSIGTFPIYNADLQEQDGFPSDVLAMGQSIAGADGVIIVTPEYNYSVPGGLKNALDWLSRLPSTPFAGKRVAIQTASPGVIGGARAQYHLRQIMVFLDAHVLNKPEVMIGKVTEKIDAATGELTDQSTRDFLTKQLTALATWARE